MIKRKWPKTVAALGFHSSITPVAPEVRASLSLPRESDKERPGSPPGPRAKRKPSSGGCRPGPPAVRGGIWASATPWLGCRKWGPKGSLEPLRNQWRARLPGPSRNPALHRTAHSFTRGRAEAWNRPRNQWRAKLEPPCTVCRLRGVQGPPWSIFGHFLLIKKVATPASDVCLTNSQTTNTSHGTR